MKDRKILFLILFSLLLLFLILYLSRTVNIETSRLKKTAEPLRSNAIRLESQVSQLQDLLHGFVRLNLAMKGNLDAEKNQNAELKETLEEITRQKETLASRLTQAGTELELTEGIRKKLAEIEQSLSSLKLEPGREKEFKNQLWEISRGLDKVNYQIPELVRENKNYKRQAEGLKAEVEKKEKELSSLKSDSREEKGRLQRLNQDILNLSGEIKSLKEAKSSLEAKSAETERLRNELKSANAGLNNEISRIKKELEEGREKLSQALQENEILRKQKESYISRIRSLEALEAQISQLQAQAESAAKDYQALKSKSQADQETLQQNILELGRRADKIVTLSDQLSGLEAKANAAQARLPEMEKDSALLRQENVSLRLEKESLNSQLTQAKEKLSDMETQASQISNILKGAPVQPAEAKRIEVEVSQETANESK